MARPNNSIGIQGDLSLGATGILHSNSLWVGDDTSPSGTGTVNSVEYVAGETVVHNDQLWVALRTNDNSEPSVTNPDWRAIQAVDSQSVVLITHNIESTPSTIQRDQLFLLDTLAYRKVSEGSITVMRSNFIISDAFNRDNIGIHPAGTYFVIPGRSVIVGTEPFNITGTTVFPTLATPGFSLVANGEDLRQGDLWIDEFDGRTSTYVATNFERTVDPGSMEAFTRGLDGNTPRLFVQIPVSDFDRLPRGEFISATFTDVAGAEVELSNGLRQETAPTDGNNKFLVFSLLPPEAAIFSDMARFPNDPDLAENPAPERVYDLRPIRLSVLGGSWIQIGGLHVDGGANFEFGTFRAPVETPLNFGTFEIPTGPALNLGAL